MIREDKINCIRQSRSPFKRWDILVFGAALALTATLLFTLFSNKGETVEIVSSGTKTILPLNKNAERIIDGKLTVVIANGECWIKCSTCDKKTCERTGKIKYVNQRIVCAENKVVVKIVGKSDSVAGIIR